MTFTGKRRNVLDVCAKQCDQCLFSKAKIVDDDRKAEILANIETKDTHFSCHKHNIEDRDVVCRGDFNRDPRRTMVLRMAHHYGLLRFIDEDGNEKHGDQGQADAARRSRP